MDACVKRRRSGSPSQIVNESRDYYEKAIRSDANSIVLSCWLRRIAGIQKLSSIQEDHMPPLSETEHSSLKDEIKSLSCQLLQIKRRLAPAAERCSEICNALCRTPLTTGRQEFVEARRACNPFEALGEGQRRGLNSMFMNRSAIKLANIDALLSFALTHHDGLGPFRFADICGAPGGFSEYILRKCKSQRIPFCQGYGMSLLGRNEHGEGLRWKLQDHTVNENGFYAQYTICTGADGTGDILQWQNIEAFRSFIAKSDQDISNVSDRESSKVHLVVADGGVDAQRDAEDQDLVTQKLVICEVAASLEILRCGGTLLIKMFGFQPPVIRAMMTDLLSHFDSIKALKPISSRPASSERYVVFAGFKGSNEESWRHWQNKILQSVDSSNFVSRDHGRIARYMDEFDRDMLILNIKACFSILSHLEMKSLSSTLEEVEQYELAAWNQVVNAESYKIAWNLF